MIVHPTMFTCKDKFRKTKNNPSINQSLSSSNLYNMFNKLEYSKKHFFNAILHLTEHLRQTVKQ